MSKFPTIEDNSLQIEVMFNTFHIKFRNHSIGSAFQINFRNKIYLITAAHVVNRIDDKDVIYIFNDSRWKWYDVETIYFGNPESYDDDVAILIVNNFSPFEKPKIDLSEIQFGSNQSKYRELESFARYFGEEVHYFGFPLALHSSFPEKFSHINFGGFPMPFVKSGLISNFATSQNIVTEIYIDAYANQGFSGGPVFLMGKKENNLIGVLTKFLIEEIEPNISSNSGIAICTLFDHVLEKLDSN